MILGIILFFYPVINNLERLDFSSFVKSFVKESLNALGQIEFYIYLLILVIFCYTFIKIIIKKHKVRKLILYLVIFLDVAAILFAFWVLWLFIPSPEDKCNSINDEIEKYECLIDIATKTTNTSLVDNPSLCEKLTDRLNFTMNECYTSLAESTNNPSICENVHSTDQFYKFWCYKSLAESTNNPSICENLENEINEYNDKNYRDACYRNLIEAFKDSNLCEKIINQETKDGCYFDLAYEVRNSTLCEKLSNQTMRENCIISVNEAH